MIKFEGISVNHYKNSSYHRIQQIFLMCFIMLLSAVQGKAQDTIPTEAEFEVIGSSNVTQLTQLKSWQPDNDLFNAGTQIRPSDGSNIFLLVSCATNVISTIHADSLSLGLTYPFEKDKILGETAISPNGQFAAMNGYSTVDVWDAENDHLKFNFISGEDFEVGHVEFSPDNRLFAYGYVNTQAPSEEDGVYVIDLGSGKQTHFLAQISASEFAFSPDSQFMASGDTNGEVRIWNLQDNTYTQLRSPDNKILTQVSYVNSETLAVAFYETGHGDEGRGLEFWDIAQSQALNTKKHDALSFYFKDGIGQTVSDDYTAIQLWTVSDNKDLALLKNVNLEDINPADNLVLTSSKEGEIQFRYLDTGEIIGTLDSSIEAHKNANLSFDKHYLIVWGEDGQVQLWGIPKTRVDN
jgi:WD40 repeat protein